MREVRNVGLLDAFFKSNVTPTVGSILPEAAKQEILAGRLPQINTDALFLKKGEYCCYIDKALLLVDKTKRIHKHHGTSAPGLFKGTRFNWGTGYTKEYVETQEHKAILFITNKRIILQCKGQGFDKQHRYLSAIQPYSNGIELQYGNKTYNIIVQDGRIPYAAIKLIQERGANY